MDWHDPARDLVNFLLHYMPSDLQAQLPMHLPRVHALEVEQRKQTGFSDRKLVTIGHSFGGTVTYVSYLERCCPCSRICLARWRRLISQRWWTRSSFLTVLWFTLMILSTRQVLSQLLFLVETAGHRSKLNSLTAWSPEKCTDPYIERLH